MQFLVCIIFPHSNYVLLAQKCSFSPVKHSESQEASYEYQDLLIQIFSYIDHERCIQFLCFSEILTGIFSGLDCIHQPNQSWCFYKASGFGGIQERIEISI